MKTRSSGRWLLALGCATALAIALAAPASAQRHSGGSRHDGSGIWHDYPGWRGGSWHGGGGNWHGGSRNWHGGYGRGWGWRWGGGIIIAPQPHSYCSYGCYGNVPPAYYGY